MFDRLGPLLIVHVVAALVAMASGAIVVLLPKGTRRHRRVAIVYVTAMIVTTGVVAFVPATTLKFGDSGYGFFHVFIVVGLVSSLVGIFSLYKWRRTRERRWLYAPDAFQLQLCRAADGGRQPGRHQSALRHRHAADASDLLGGLSSSPTF